MATYLSKDSIERAADHIVRYGDTDVFPHLIETAFLDDCKDKIVDALAELDVDQFTPHQSEEALAPKSRYGFRIANQLSLLMHWSSLGARLRSPKT